MAYLSFRRGIPGVLPSAWLIQPERPTLARPVIAVHGLNRETEVMAELLAPRADETGRTVILPIFDTRSWRRFQRAACADRSDWALLRLLQVLRDEGTIGAAAPDMSGFSGGAQFAHRFAWLYPDRVGHLCLVAPGWWTFPDARGAYPLGIAGGRGLDAMRLRANLARFLDRDMRVLVGALDVAQDKNLRQDRDTVGQQGPNRIMRARNWTAAAIRTARHLGIRPRMSFHLMQDCGHSFAECVAHGGLSAAFVPMPDLETQRPDLFRHDQLEEVA